MCIRDRAQTLSKKNSDKNLYILADIKKEIKKTKEFNKFLEKNNLANALIISDEDTLKNIGKSARNIKNIKLIKQEGTNIYDLFKYKNVIIYLNDQQYIFIFLFSIIWFWFNFLLFSKFQIRQK